MSGIRIVTDSAGDLPGELLEAHSVITVPLDVRLGEQGPEELRSVTPEEFWKRAGESSALGDFGTEPGAFAEAFRQAKADGSQGACCVTISSALSATYQSACAGVAALEGEFPVEIVDSRFATLGEGLLVLEACEHAEAGGDLESVARATRAAVEKVSVFGTLDTLENLQRGGRIGGAQAFLGSLLSIKPVIEVRDGVVEPESRQRTRPRSLQYLVDKVAEAGKLRRLGIAHAAAADLDNFLQLLATIQQPEELVISHIGPVIGSHTGAGTVGVCMQRA